MSFLSGCAAVLLASGQSTRFGAPDKLMAPFRGRALVDWSADTVASAGFLARIAVVAADADPVRERLADRGFTVIANPDPARGLGASIALAADTLADLGIDGVVLVLADMPFVTAQTLERLVAEAENGASAVFCSRNGILGPPAFVTASAIARLRTLDGEKGAKSLVSEFAMVSRIHCENEELADIDRPEDLRRYEATT